MPLLLLIISSQKLGLSCFARIPKENIEQYLTNNFHHQDMYGWSPDSGGAFLTGYSDHFSACHRFNGKSRKQKMPNSLDLISNCIMSK